MFPGLELYYTDPTQPLTTAGGELDDLDHDLSHLSDLSVRDVKRNLVHQPVPYSKMMPHYFQVVFVAKTCVHFSRLWRAIIPFRNSPDDSIEREIDAI